MKVCVNASLILSLVLPWEESEKADALWEEWIREKVEVIGPPLLFAEVTSVLREAVYRTNISPDEGEEAFRTLLGLGIRKVDHPELHIKAWKLASDLNQPRAYDAHYLALAELEGSELWTQDRRFYRSARARFTNVKWVGEHSP